MQSRYRGPRDGLRAGSALSSGSRFLPYGRDVGRGSHNPYPSPRKFDILMEAGRLAAEYWVSRGVIPQEVLCGKYPNGSPPGFERQTRVIPPPSEGRTSALSRLGHRFGDDGRFGSRRRGRLWKRAAPYSRVYDTDSGREIVKSRNWIERGRGDSSLAEEEKEFPSSFRWNLSGGVEIKGGALRVSADEQLTPSESTSEKNYELADDSLSKASSSCTKKDQQLEPASSSTTTKKDQRHEADEGSSLVVDEIKTSISEMVDEVRSERSDKLEKQSVEENEDSISCADEGDAEMKDCKDLLKLCCFTKVPTKPRSSVSNRSPKIDQRSVASTPLEVAGREEVKNLHFNEKISSKMCSPEDHSSHSDKLMEEAVDLHHESFHDPLNSETLGNSLIERHDDGIKPSVEESKISDESRAFRVSDEFEHRESTLNKKVEQDLEMDELGGEGLDSTSCIHKDKDESTILVGDAMQHQNSASFRICDLNLAGSPDTSEVPIGSSMDHFTSAHRIDMHKGVSPDCNMATRNDTEDACNDSQLMGHAKVVQVINLEEDSHEDLNSFDPSKHKNDISYSSLELVLKQATHSDDLHALQDGYNLEFSEFLGSDISGCPSAHESLNNLQPGMGLHGAEGYSGVDDHIYVSLEEIPIGFMGVWDQPSQDYEKFF